MEDDAGIQWRVGCLTASYPPPFPPHCLCLLFCVQVRDSQITLWGRIARLQLSDEVRPWAGQRAFGQLTIGMIRNSKAHDSAFFGHIVHEISRLLALLVKQKPTTGVSQAASSSARPPEASIVPFFGPLLPLADGELVARPPTYAMSGANDSVEAGQMDTRHELEILIQSMGDICEKSIRSGSVPHDGTIRMVYNICFLPAAKCMEFLNPQLSVTCITQTAAKGIPAQHWHSVGRLEGQR